MGGASVLRGEEILNAAGIPTFPFPDAAAGAFADMWRYSENLRALYETPELTEACIDKFAAQTVLEPAHIESRTLLTEAESKQLLAAYAIPVARTEIAETEDQAAQLAAKIGFPVVLKLHSRTITHKTDVAGGELDLRDEPAVRAAFKRIQAGVSTLTSADQFEGVTVQPMVRMTISKAGLE